MFAASNLEKIRSEVRELKLKAAAIEALLEQAPDALEPSAAQGEWLHSDSPGVPVGCKVWARLARSRHAAGLPGVGRVGRKWTMTRQALGEEIAKLGHEPKATTPDATERLRAELGGA